MFSWSCYVTLLLSPARLMCYNYNALCGTQAAGHAAPGSVSRGCGGQVVSALPVVCFGGAGMLCLS